MQAGEPNPQSGTRTMRYCVVPPDLAPALHALLKRRFVADPNVEVVIEARDHVRRQLADRRASATSTQTPDAPSPDRRRIRAQDGRRAGERRAALLDVDPLPLPRKASHFAARLKFFERLEPSGQQREDLDTARLVARIQSGESDSFPLLYLRYFDRVYTYLVIALT
ncbi:MAG TPA: hypothetical protein VGN69_01765, partial [Solirubrobacteraceae bacterium]|nr:hypothetical protein [Solirubrobacteraceae bacterium]